MTLTEFALHIAVFVVPGLLIVGWDLLNELPLRAGRWVSAGDLTSP